MVDSEVTVLLMCSEAPTLLLARKCYSRHAAGLSHAGYALRLDFRLLQSETQLKKPNYCCLCGCCHHGRD